MKKILSIIVALLIGVCGVMGQGQINRTNKTIVADVLAKLPAANQQTYNEQLADLALTGEEGITMLVQLLNGSDVDSQVLAEYALAGLAAYISGQKDETLRSIIVLAYNKGLGITQDKQKQIFLKRQIILMGGNETIAGEAMAVPVVKVKLTGDATKEVLNALKKADRIERNRVFNLASADADVRMYVEIIKAIKKAKPDVKMDVLSWLGREASSCPEKKATLKNLEIKVDQSARTTLLKYLEEPSFQVKEAAVWALTKIGDPANIYTIATMLSADNKEVVDLAQAALASYPGDISSSIVKVLPQLTNDGGKIAALELLALRKSDTNSSAVYAQAESASPEVKKAAYDALKDVVKPSDFARLSSMLESGGAVAPLQEALIASIASQSPDEQLKTVNNRMIQAGAARYWQLPVTRKH